MRLLPDLIENNRELAEVGMQHDLESTKPQFQVLSAEEREQQLQTREAELADLIEQYESNRQQLEAEQADLNGDRQQLEPQPGCIDLLAGF